MRSRPGSTTTAPCPSGEVRVGADQVTIEPANAEETLWRVVIDGRATNASNATILVSDAVALVRIGEETTQLNTDSEPFELRAGSAFPFRIDETVTSDERPVPDRLDLSYGWALASQSSCPTPPATAQFS